MGWFSARCNVGNPSLSVGSALLFRFLLVHPASGRPDLSNRKTVLNSQGQRIDGGEKDEKVGKERWFLKKPRMPWEVWTKRIEEELTALEKKPGESIPIDRRPLFDEEAEGPSPLESSTGCWKEEDQREGDDLPAETEEGIETEDLGTTVWEFPPRPVDWLDLDSTGRGRRGVSSIPLPGKRAVRLSLPVAFVLEPQRGGKRQRSFRPPGVVGQSIVKAGIARCGSPSVSPAFA